MNPFFPREVLRTRERIEEETQLEAEARKQKTANRKQKTDSQDQLWRREHTDPVMNPKRSSAQDRQTKSVSFQPNMIGTEYGKEWESGFGGIERIGRATEATPKSKAFYG